MENTSQISQYISQLAIIAIVTGIISLLGDKMQGGMGKFLSIACSLTVALHFLSPLTVFLTTENDYSFEISVPTEQYQSEDEYLKLLTKETLASLQENAQNEISRLFNIKTTDYTVSFSGDFEQNKFQLYQCDITFFTIHALAYREKIQNYINESYGCNCIFTESII